MIYNVRQPVYQQQQQLIGVEQTIKQSSANMLAEKIIIGLDHAPPAFNLREQLMGGNGANLQYIRKETGVNISLRGIGSLFVDPNTGLESQEPLHFYIEHQRFENINSAKQLAKNLIETLQQEFLQFQQHKSPALPQINIPPPSIINVPPPSIIQANVMSPAQAQPANIIHQQYVTQGGIPIHVPQGNMVIQQQPGAQNLNIPPPMKQIVQFHQPPPSIQASGAPLHNSQAATSSPIILNHQPQASIQYQYIQQPSTDGQGNHVTLQHMYQHPQQIQGIQMQAAIPPPNLQQQQQQQQYITVQGNTAYMVPPPTIIQQTGGQQTQLSIIQHPPPLHMQLPTGSITVQAPMTEAMGQLEQQSQIRAELTAAENEEYSAEKLEDSEQHLLEEETVAPTSESESSALVRTMTSVPPPQQQLMRQMPPPPMTHVPPPTITMSVPPPMNGVQQHIVGNTTLYTTTPGNIQQFQQHVIPQQTQQFIHTASNGQNYVMNTATPQWQTRAPQSTQFVTQQITASDVHSIPPPVSMGGIPVSGAPVQQTAPVAVTFSQPMMQQQLQLQFQPQMMQQVQMQPQPAAQQFNIIQTQQPPPQQQLLQQHQQQSHHQQQSGMGLISVSQNGFSYTQTAPSVPQTFVQQQQIRALASYGEQMIARPGQKRKSTNDATDAPPLMQPRIGVGAQREVADFTIAPPPPPATSNSNLNSTGGVGIGQGKGPDPTTTTVNASEAKQPLTQTHTIQNQKPTGNHPAYIGMMRYNSDIRGGAQSSRPQYTSGPPPPRGRMMLYGNYNNSIRPPLQHDANYRVGFGPPPYRVDGSGQGMNYGPRRMQR